MIEKLWCENGQHWHERESKRGKKPKNCPHHGDLVKCPLPPKSAPECSACKGTGLSPNLTVETSDEAICSICGGSGEKPKPERNEAGERKLICAQNGHEWWAPVQRGRPPRFCPDHRSQTHSIPRSHIVPYEIRETSQAIIEGRQLYCHAGDHTWEAERKRGKPPLSCPEHSEKGAIERKIELNQEKKEKAQKSLQEAIDHLSARVSAAEIVDRDAMTKLSAAGGADKADEETFKRWLCANSALLHEVESLRARERKLVEL
jgi:hypothetical protein